MKNKTLLSCPIYQLPENREPIICVCDKCKVNQAKYTCRIIILQEAIPEQYVSERKTLYYCDIDDNDELPHPDDEQLCFDCFNLKRRNY